MARRQGFRVPRASIAVTIFDDPEYVALCQTAAGREAWACYTALIAQAKVQRNGGIFTEPVEVIAMLIRWPTAAAKTAIDSLLNAPGDWVLHNGSTITIRSFKRWNKGWGGKRKGGGRKSSGNQDETKLSPLARAPVSASASVLPNGSTVGGVPPTSPRALSEQTPFSQFWLCWPKGGRKAGRKQCHRAWNAAALDGKAGEVLGGLTRWLRSREWAADSGEYIPAPLVWLNQARWEADPPPNVEAAGIGGMVETAPCSREEAFRLLGVDPPNGAR